MSGKKKPAGKQIALCLLLTAAVDGLGVLLVTLLAVKGIVGEDRVPQALGALAFCAAFAGGLPAGKGRLGPGGSLLNAGAFALLLLLLCFGGWGEGIAVRGLIRLALILLGGLLAVYEIAHSEVLLVKAAKVGDLLLKAFDGELFPSVESFSRSHVAEYRAGDRGDDAQRARDAGGGGDAGGGAATPLRSDARQAVRDGSGATADGAAAAGDAGRRVPRPDIPLTPFSRP